MRTLNNHSSRPVPTVLMAMAAAAALLLSSQALACPSCNDSFMHEVMTERQHTATGQDIMAAVANQRGLPLGAADSITASSVAAAAAARGTSLNPVFEGADFIEIIERDEGLEIPATSFVPQNATPDVEFTIRLDEGQTYIGQGVIYDGFVSDGKVPGPTLRVTEGDIVRITVENTGTVPHGASIHAADTQTSKYIGQIGPGESKSVTFRANMPGVYMWHCAPGGHAIPMHVLFGQYGMIVVEPKETKYQLEQKLGHGPDLTLYLIQHEFYASGKEAVEGQPSYTAFNGRVFRYVEEPITAKPGDYVRIYFLNIGPNLVSTFHLVGIVWDFVHWQGHPDAWMPGGQTVTAGPSDSWVIEFRVPPDEGTYLMLSHAVGSTSRGAIGALVATNDADTPKTILADGPEFTEEELAEIRETAVRAISPFAPTEKMAGVQAKADRVVSYGPEVKEVFVEIIGNSYYPKVIEIEPGTKVTWVNEDVFTYMAGEFSGVHNAVATRGPEIFATRMLGHAESDSFTFTQSGEYNYICTPHPYMQGRIIVRETD
jgi:nitrite reductase (NO-forming)